MTQLTQAQKDAALAPAQETVTAITAFDDAVPEKAVLLTEAKQLVTDISAAIVPPPVPTFVRYPDADLVLSEKEQLFGDYPGPQVGATSAWQKQSLVDMSYKPGNWVNMGNAPFTLENIGGDWYDAGGTKQGLAPFGTFAFTDFGSAVPAWFDSTDLSALVNGFIDGTYPNWGFALRAVDSSSTIICESMYCADPANRPQLVITVGGVTTTLTPQAMVNLYGTQLTTQSRNPTFQFAKNNLAYVYFDFTAFKGQVVTAAKLRVHSTNQYGNSTGLVLRARNASVETPRNPVTYGIAKDFPEDVGLENHPSVLMVQRCGPDFESYWMGGLGVKYGTSSNYIERITDPNQMLLGKYPVLRVSHLVGGDQSAIERFTPLWRGFNYIPGRLLPAPPKRIFIRYIARFNNGQFGEHPWHPAPSGGKLPGVDGRFTAHGNSYVNPNWPVLTPTMPGCGVGNSGNHCSGGAGCSARGNYDQTPIGTQMENLAGFGNGDCYNADNSGQYGDGNQRWDIGLGGHARLGEFVDIEVEYWVNTTTDDTQKQVRLASIVNNGDGTATATLHPDSPQRLAGNPKYTTGEKWTTMGSLMSSEPGTSPTKSFFTFNQVGTPITVLSDTQFKYAVPPITGSHAVAANGPGGAIWLTAVAAQGNFDGGLRGWVNGRLVAEHPDIRFWHAAWLPDGVTPTGWDFVWWCVYQGGGVRPTANASMDLAEMVVATERIGPMVVTR